MVAIGKLQLQIKLLGRFCFLLKSVFGICVCEGGLNAAYGCVIFHSSNFDVINLSSKFKIGQIITVKFDRINAIILFLVVLRLDG